MIKGFQKEVYVRHGRKDQPDCGKHIALVTDIVGDRASERRGKIMHDLVARPILRRTLQKQHGHTCEHRNGDPIVDSFQICSPLALGSLSDLLQPNREALIGEPG